MLGVYLTNTIFGQENMKSIIKQLGWLVVLANTSVALADEAAVRKALGKFMPSETIERVKQSEINGLYEVVSGSNIFYASEDGKYLIQGQLYDAEAKKNITESKLAGVRKSTLEKVGEQKMILFKSPTQRHVVTVFTDIDCGYCRKLHSEIDQYLAQGITVRYMFYPRAGKGSDSYSKAVSVWCASDRNKAITAAKKGDLPETKQCDNPVDEHMRVAESFGVNGTPMIVTQTGNILPGYVPAPQLAKALESE